MITVVDNSKKKQNFYFILEKITILYQMIEVLATEIT